MDIFIRVGEFSTRSEVIRHAVKEYITNQSDRIAERADKLKRVQDIEATVEAIKPYMKK
jgi:Arc/MetJ-type ribon-helix-helix transcriptional regulator